MQQNLITKKMLEKYRKSFSIKWIIIKLGQIELDNGSDDYNNKGGIQYPHQQSALITIFFYFIIR